MKPLAKEPKLPPKAWIDIKIPIRTVLFERELKLAIYPRPGPKIAARAVPHNKKMRIRRGMFELKAIRITNGMQKKVPIPNGILRLSLSAIHPPALSPATMPIVEIANMAPIREGETSIEVR